MNKGELIFDWREGEGHAGRKFVSWLVVGVLAVVLGGVIDVKMKGVELVKSETGGVYFFSDEMMREYWTQKAEEDGPFPGGLEFFGDDALSMDGDGAWMESERWSGGEIVMRPLVEEQDGGVRVMERGGRYFPERRGVREDMKMEERAVTKRVPVIFAYEKEGAEWLPKDLPVFQAGGAEYSSSTVWRFLLQLRGDGSVGHCIPLSGGEGELQALMDWVEGLRFATSETDVRWMGLRVEFLNVSGDGSDSE